MIDHLRASIPIHKGPRILISRLQTEFAAERRALGLDEGRTCCFRPFISRTILLIRLTPFCPVKLNKAGLLSIEGFRAAQK
jgi:hypothetical protein